MGWYRRTSTFVNYAFRFYKSRNTLSCTHNPNSGTKPFSTISKFSQPNLRNNRNLIQESISIPKPTSKFFQSIFKNRNPIQESLSRTKPFSKITKLSKSILRNIHRNPVQESISIPKPSSKIFQSIIRNRNPIQKSISSVFSQSILRNLNLHNGLKPKNPFLDGAKRFHHHCVARSNEIVLITKQRKRWYNSEDLLASAFIIAFGVLITLCFGNFETVPYSKRFHVVLLPRTLEKYLGNYLFEKKKEENKENILAPDHPNSIRVQRISQAVIEALKKGLSKEHIACSSDDGILVDDRGIIVKRGKAKRKKKKRATAHLESFEWEVIVVDSYQENAFCLPGGKIVVYSGLLREFKDDAEVAIIIGHEVGHAVARHSAENFLRLLWSFIVKMIFCQYMEDHTHAGKISDGLFALFVLLPFSRRNEMEADYIGLLLAASAGYDPRVAPKVFEKLGGSGEESYLDTHPSGKKRAEKLSQAQVMEDALSIYRHAQAEQAVGFL